MTISQTRTTDYVQTDLSGQKFGDLTAVNLSRVTSEMPYKSFWNCKCICGKTKEVTTFHLKSGITKNCGCKPHEHKSTA